MCSDTCELDPYCGDNIKDDNEECDGTDLGGITDPDAVCSDTCELDPYCGDDIKDDNEVCDGDDFGIIGKPHENAICSDSCNIDPYCGDGIKDDNEACDDGNLDELDGCRSDCSVQSCGDGIKDDNEDCDLGAQNGQPGSSCSATCDSLRDECDRDPQDAAYGNPDCCAGTDQPSKHGDIKTYKGSKGTDYHVMICLPKSIYSDSRAAGSSDARRAYDRLRSQGVSSRWRSPGTWNVDTRFFGTYTNECWKCAPVRLGGCFAPETLITLADGSEVAIEDLEAGDLVYNPVTEEKVAIRSILESGEEEPIISISTDSNTVNVTQTHPMVTDRGIVKASDVLSGDRILVENGSYRTVRNATELPISYSQRVLNIILDTDSKDADDHMVLADGIVTGDLIVQRQINK